MFCKNCGTDVTDMKYCPKCGTRVEPENNRNVQKESVETEKKLTIVQIKWLSFSVVLTAWGLLLITSSLLPYIMAEIRYDYSDYNIFSYIYPISYFALSVFACIKFHILLKSSDYVMTPQYKFSREFALNKSNLLQMIMFAVFIWYSMVSNRRWSNGALWGLSALVLIGCLTIWIYWFRIFRATREEDKKAIFTVIYISFREFWISIVCFLIADLFIFLTSSLVLLGLIFTALIFVYPAARYVRSKRVLRDVYKVK